MLSLLHWVLLAEPDVMAGLPLVEGLFAQRPSPPQATRTATGRSQKTACENFLDFHELLLGQEEAYVTL